jgi:endonuclease III-like uncharacterized protein
MKKEEITKIIESTLTSGNKTPGLFDLPKMFALKTQLQSCQSIDEVLTIIAQHRDLLSNAFGLGKEAIDSALERIKALEGK